jgi:hypothetical protein
MEDPVMSTGIILRLHYNRLRSSAKVVNNTNIIVLNIPYRHDVDKNSCVNKEIQTFNWKLRKMIKLFKHVTILEVSFSREAFTQHGLHLNRLGKRLIAKQIAREIYAVLKEKIQRGPKKCTHSFIVDIFGEK